MDLLFLIWEIAQWIFHLVNWCFVSLGIVYTHRNEDIVNFGPGIQGKIDTSIPLDDSLVKPSISLDLDHQRKKPDSIPKKQKVPLIDERKRTQYRLLAQSLGMGELAFSKWLLSATPLEREKVLLDFKKKKKIPNGWSQGGSCGWQKVFLVSILNSTKTFIV